MERTEWSEAEREIEMTVVKGMSKEGNCSGAESYNKLVR